VQAAVCYSRLPLRPSRFPLLQAGRRCSLAAADGWHHRCYTLMLLLLLLLLLLQGLLVPPHWPGLRSCLARAPPAGRWCWCPPPPPPAALLPLTGQTRLPSRLPAPPLPPAEWCARMPYMSPRTPTPRAWGLYIPHAAVWQCVMKRLLCTCTHACMHACRGAMQLRSTSCSAPLGGMSSPPGPPPGTLPSLGPSAAVSTGLGGWGGGGVSAGAHACARMPHIYAPLGYQAHVVMASQAGNKCSVRMGQRQTNGATPFGGRSRPSVLQHLASLLQAHPASAGPCTSCLEGCPGGVDTAS